MSRSDRPRRQARLLAAGLLWLVGACASARPYDVLIDPGHSPARPGATSAHGHPEHGYNRRFVDRLVAVLQRQGVRVLRSDEVGAELSLTDRTARSGDARLFLSIHHDSIQQDWIDRGWRRHFHGYALFVSMRNPASEASLACATRLGDALNAAGEQPSRYHETPIPGENRPMLDRARGVHRFDDLVVLRTSRVPAVLVEVGVIAHPDDAVRLADPLVVERLARAIASGVLDCLAVVGPPRAKTVDRTRRTREGPATAPR